MARTSKAFRLSDEVVKRLANLADLLGQSETAIVERAINALYEGREQAMQADVEARKGKLKKD